jgi:hypothetical protein
MVRFRKEKYMSCFVVTERKVVVVVVLVIVIVIVDTRHFRTSNEMRKDTTDVLSCRFRRIRTAGRTQPA